MINNWAKFIFLSGVISLVDADPGFELNSLSDRQIYFSKAPRFIKFDAKDEEVEIELGVSVPVVKVPLSPPVGRSAAKKESGITISAPGLVVAGVLMLTTYLVVPLLFSKKIYRSGKMGIADDIWSVIKEIERGIYNNLSDSSPCVELLACWTANAKENGTADWINDVLRSEWMTRLVNGTFVERAILAGRNGSDCWEKYKNCPTLSTIHKIVQSRSSTKKQS